MLSADMVRLPCEYVMRRLLPFSGCVLTPDVCAQVFLGVVSVCQRFTACVPSLGAPIPHTAVVVCVFVFSLYVPMVLTMV